MFFPIKHLFDMTLYKMCAMKERKKHSCLIKSLFLSAFSMLLSIDVSANIDLGKTQSMKSDTKNAWDFFLVLQKMRTLTYLEGN